MADHRDELRCFSRSLPY